MESEKQILDLEMLEIFPKNIQDYIQPRYSLVKEINESKAVKIITTLAKKVPNYEKKLHDLELLILVCLYIENMKIRSSHKSKKVDKKAVLTNIYHLLFNVLPDSEEMQKVYVNVEFLLNHNKIKKFTYVKKLFLSLKAYLLKME